MGKQRRDRNLLVVVSDRKSGEEEFRLCSTQSCRNAIGTWTIPQGYSGPVYCAECVHLVESR